MKHIKLVTITEVTIMRSPQVYLLFIILVSGLGSLSSGEPINEDFNIERAPSGLPQFFNFDWFMRSFDKVYLTWREYIARKKIYLGNLMTVFVSQVSFKHGQSSYYLRVNQMADRSPAELNMLYSNQKLTNIYLRQDKDQSDYEINGQSEVDRNLVLVNKLESNEIPIRDVQEGLTKGSLNVVEVKKELEADHEIGVDMEVPRLFRNKRDVTNKIKSVKLKHWMKSFLSSKADARVINLPRLEKGMRSDLRRTGCLNSVKDQASCGSCYIFSTLALLEFHHCLETGELLDLSEQYILDCGHLHASMDGCGGGSPYEVIQFVNKFGLDLQKNYPYKGSLGQCPFMGDSIAARSGKLLTQELSLVEVATHLVDETLEDHTPLIVILHTAPDYHLYGGGVHNPGQSCRRDRFHGGLAVGSGIEDGLEYYLIRDSHSEKFGERGYYKLAKESVGDCVIAWAVTDGLLNGDPLIKAKNKHHRKKFLDTSKRSES